MRQANYSSARRNSSPKSRMSPTDSVRRTLAEIGGVSLGTRPDEVGEGVGMVRWTTWSNRRMCVDAMQAPVALIFNVLVSSMNSMPDASEPRINTGTWSLILGERRC